MDTVNQLLERVRRFAAPQGEVKPCNVQFAQAGEMRLAPGQAWRPFTARQWMSGNALDFRWVAWLRMARAVPVCVVDAFESGSGRLTVSAFGVLPLARQRGPAVDQGEVQRALAELPWRPFLFRRTPWMIWEAVDSRMLRATYDDGRTRASADFAVDDEGRVVGASAIRPRLVGASLVPTPWTGAFADYRPFGRLRIPASAEVAWALEDGPFVYWRGRIASFPTL